MLIALLPVAILGATYFLMIEWVLANLSPNAPAVHVALRLGGLALIVVALIFAAACGYLLVERVSRPVRLLARLAESGDLSAARNAFLHHHDWEILELYRKVSALVHQNQAGAKAVEELERLREGMAVLRKQLAQPGHHGVAPSLSLAKEGAIGEIEAQLMANRARLLEFFTELKDRLESVKGEADLLAHRWPESTATLVEATHATNGANGEARLAHVDLERAQSSLAGVRRVGTVLALHSERETADAGRLGHLFARFDSSVGQLESELKSAAARLEREVNGNGSAPESAIPSAAPSRVLSEELNGSLHRLRAGLGMLERRLNEVEVK